MWTNPSPSDMRVVSATGCVFLLQGWPDRRSSSPVQDCSLPAYMHTAIPRRELMPAEPLKEEKKDQLGQIMTQLLFHRSIVFACYSRLVWRDYSLHQPADEGKSYSIGSGLSGRDHNCPVSLGWISQEVVVVVGAGEMQCILVAILNR